MCFCRVLVLLIRVGVGFRLFAPMSVCIKVCLCAFMLFCVYGVFWTCRKFVCLFILFCWVGCVLVWCGLSFEFVVVLLIDLGLFMAFVLLFWFKIYFAFWFCLVILAMMLMLLWYFFTAFVGLVGCVWIAGSLSY